MPYTYRNVVFFCSIYAYLLNLICPINYHNYHIFKIIVRLKTGQRLSLTTCDRII